MGLSTEEQVLALVEAVDQIEWYLAEFGSAEQAGCGLAALVHIMRQIESAVSEALGCVDADACNNERPVAAGRP